jgi:hypothetical protein
MKIIRDGAPAGGFSRSSPCCLRVHCADLSHLDLAGAMRATGESYLKLFPVSRFFLEDFPFLYILNMNM